MYKYLTLKFNHPASGSQVLFFKTNINPVDGGEIIRLQKSPERDIWNVQYVTGSLGSPTHISRQIGDLLSQISSSNSPLEETTETEFINAYNQVIGSFNNKITG
jgi:hypothetical protein